MSSAFSQRSPGRIRGSGQEKHCPEEPEQDRAEAAGTCTSQGWVVLSCPGVHNTSPSWVLNLPHWAPQESHPHSPGTEEEGLVSWALVLQPQERRQGGRGCSVGAVLEENDMNGVPTISLCRRGDGGSWQLAVAVALAFVSLPFLGAVRGCSVMLSGSRVKSLHSCWARESEWEAETERGRSILAVRALNNHFWTTQSHHIVLSLPLSPVTWQTTPHSTPGLVTPKPVSVLNSRASTSIPIHPPQMQAHSLRMCVYTITPPERKINILTSPNNLLTWCWISSLIFFFFSENVSVSGGFHTHTLGSFLYYCKAYVLNPLFSVNSGGPVSCCPLTLHFPIWKVNSSGQHQILNWLSKVKDWTFVLMDAMLDSLPDEPQLELQQPLFLKTNPQSSLVA